MANGTNRPLRRAAPLRCALELGSIDTLLDPPGRKGPGDGHVGGGLVELTLGREIVVVIESYLERANSKYPRPRISKRGCRRTLGNLASVRWRRLETTALGIPSQKSQKILETTSRKSSD